MYRCRNSTFKTRFSPSHTVFRISNLYKKPLRDRQLCSVIGEAMSASRVLAYSRQYTKVFDLRYGRHVKSAEDVLQYLCSGSHRLCIQLLFALWLSPSIESIGCFRQSSSVNDCSIADIW